MLLPPPQPGISLLTVSQADRPWRRSRAHRGKLHPPPQLAGRQAGGRGRAHAHTPAREGGKHACTHDTRAQAPLSQGSASSSICLSVPAGRAAGRVAPEPPTRPFALLSLDGYLHGSGSDETHARSAVGSGWGGHRRRKGGKYGWSSKPQRRAMLGEVKRSPSERSAQRGSSSRGSGKTVRC